MSTARRSERLRRKNAAPSNPNRYKLYGSGYTVESSASFLPPTPQPRRKRFSSSPHHLIDTSPSPAHQKSLLSLLNKRPAHPKFPSAQSNNPPSFRPLYLLAFVLLLSLPTLLIMDSIASSRQLGHYSRNPRASIISTFPTISFPSVQVFPANLTSTFSSVSSLFFRPALTSSVTRAELDSTRRLILQEARRIAADEASKYILRTSKNPSEGSFERFRERYAADKGLPADFALESAGASVVYTEPSRAVTLYTWAKRYAGALYRMNTLVPQIPRPPVEVLRAGVLPGECWGFDGEKGSVTIRLARKIRVSGISIEHTPSGSVWSVLSAPRGVRVFGVDEDGNETGLGDLVFRMGEGEQQGHLQSWEVESDWIGSRVRFEIESNHGGQFTCVYRLRVHGEEVKQQGSMEGY